MKIAICFNGQIRTGLGASKNILHYIGDLLPECDFFVHTWDVTSSKPYGKQTINGVELLPKGIPGEPNRGSQCDPVLLTESTKNKFVEIYKPKAMVTENYQNFTDTHPSAIPIWHTMSTCYELKRQYEIANNFKYDVVIKIRPDALINPNRTLRQDIEFVVNDLSFLYSHCYSDQRLDDVFWISSSDTADKMIGLTDIFEGIWEHPNAPDTMVLNYLKEKGIVIHELSCDNIWEYGIYRYESLHLDPIIQFYDCLMLDFLWYSTITYEDYKNKLAELKQRPAVRY